MNKLFYLVLLMFPLLFCNCKKDDGPCKDIVCENGGSCESGTCDCPDNTTGEFCEIKLPSALLIDEFFYAPGDFGFCFESVDNNTPVYLKIKVNDSQVWQSQSKIFSPNSFPNRPEATYFPNPPINVRDNDRVVVEIWRDCPPGDTRDGFSTSYSFRPEYANNNFEFFYKGLGGFSSSSPYLEVFGTWKFD